MRWWPFHRRRRPSNGQAALAKQEAARAIRDATHRSAAIEREINVFAAQVEAAMRRRP